MGQHDALQFSGVSLGQNSLLKLAPPLTLPRRLLFSSIVLDEPQSGFVRLQHVRRVLGIEVRIAAKGYQVSLAP